jgi:hypothetical protein
MAKRSRLQTKKHRKGKKGGGNDPYPDLTGKSVQECRAQAMGDAHEHQSRGWMYQKHFGTPKNEYEAAYKEVYDEEWEPKAMTDYDYPYDDEHPGGEIDDSHPPAAAAPAAAPLAINSAPARGLASPASQSKPARKAPAAAGSKRRRHTKKTHRRSRK